MTFIRRLMEIKEEQLKMEADRTLMLGALCMELIKNKTTLKKLKEAVKKNVY